MSRLRRSLQGLGQGMQQAGMMGLQQQSKQARAFEALKRRTLTPDGQDTPMTLDEFIRDLMRQDPMIGGGHA